MVSERGARIWNNANRGMREKARREWEARERARIAGPSASLAEKMYSLGPKLLSDRERGATSPLGGQAVEAKRKR